MSISIKKFNEIKELYGPWSSFCVWGKAIDDLSIFDNPTNELLGSLKNDIVILGKNCSRPLENKLSNIHDGRAHSTDEDLMNSLLGTKYYGAYFTDLYKYENPDGEEVMDFFVKHPEEEKIQFEYLKNEIEFVCEDKNPLFIVCGKTRKKMEKAFLRFCKYMNRSYEYIVVSHYSSYRKVYKKIRNELGVPPLES